MFRYDIDINITRNFGHGSDELRQALRGFMPRAASPCYVGRHTERHAAHCAPFAAADVRFSMPLIDATLRFAACLCH